MSSAISFAYFTEILYLNISRTTSNVSTAFFSFILSWHGVLCDTLEKNMPKKNQDLTINTVPCFFS